MSVTDKQPTESGAVENSYDFRSAAQQAWKASGSGTQNREAGFVTYKEPLHMSDQVPANPGSEMEIRMPKNALGSAHTHAIDRQSDPSPADVEAAKKSGKWIWVVSRAGLYSISPKGAVEHIYKSPSWATDKSPK
jgi:hypothetical protein